jgi:hypothetical protein
MYPPSRSDCDHAANVRCLAINVLVGVSVVIGIHIPATHYCKGAEQSIASSGVQVGENTYVVQMSRGEARKLELVWSNRADPASKTERVVIDGSTIPKSCVLKELKLAAWSGGNLVCIAIAQADNRDEAYILLLPFPITSIEPLTAPFKKVYDSPFRLTVLAVNGGFQGDGIVVLFGKLVPDRETGQRSVQAGAIFLDECPIPPVVYGTVSEFGRTQQR